MTLEEAIKKYENNPLGTLDSVAIDIIKEIYNSFDIEYQSTTDDRGYLIEFPQFGRFKKNTKIELFSKELK